MVSQPEDIIDQEAGSSDIFRINTQCNHISKIDTWQSKQQKKQKINNTQRISESYFKAPFLSLNDYLSERGNKS